MIVKELIAKLEKFNPELHVAAVVDDGTVYEIDVAAHTTRCRRSDAGGIKVVSPTEKDALEVVFLELDEA